MRAMYIPVLPRRSHVHLKKKKKNIDYYAYQYMCIAVLYGACCMYT